MSDFDEVLERLVTDPLFQASLSSDPDAALRGYRLEPDERALLDARFDFGAGADRMVEERITQSGVMGMVGPVVTALGFAAPPEGIPGGLPRDEAGPPPGVKTSVGEAPATGVLGTVIPTGSTTGEIAADYYTRVDADGDGTWDAYRALERGDGGVEVTVDRDGDGVADFVGYDYDRDGLIDVADYDQDFDGVVDVRMTDVDGDGWMDSSSAHPGAARGVLGYAPAPDGQ